MAPIKTVFTALDRVAMNGDNEISLVDELSLVRPNDRLTDGLSARIRNGSAGTASGCRSADSAEGASSSPAGTIGSITGILTKCRTEAQRRRGSP